jgi:hypothetical protein
MGWSELAQAVRTGAPVITDEPGARGEFFSMLVRCIFPPGYATATEAVNSLDRATRARIRKILDIGGGAAAWSIPFVEARALWCWICRKSPWSRANTLQNSGSRTDPDISRATFIR